MLNFKIIAIREEHLDGYWFALDRVARERNYLAFLEGPPKHTTRDFVLNNIAGNWPHVVAVHGNQVIGWCDITSLDRPVFAHIGSMGMGVLPEYRGLGVGTALISSALQKAFNKGLTRIELTVREHNQAAISLYEKFGFVKEGVHINGVCIDGAYENHIFMALINVES